MTRPGEEHVSAWRSQAGNEPRPSECELALGCVYDLNIGIDVIDEAVQVTRPIDGPRPSGRYASPSMVTLRTGRYVNVPAFVACDSPCGGSEIVPAISVRRRGAYDELWVEDALDGDLWRAVRMAHGDTDPRVQRGCARRG